MGQKPSTVTVKNNCEKLIRVRVDCSRSFVKCLSIDTNGKMKAPVGSISASVKYSSSYDVFHIVDTSTSFTTVSDRNELNFDLIEDGKNFAFLTVWTENNDGSWSIYCENHPITKCGEVLVAQNILTKQYKFIDQDPITSRPIYREDKIGRIVVYNRSSKNIWARVDADGIEQTKVTAVQSAEASTGKISLSESNKVSAERKVYYRAAQGKGYTLVRNNGKSRDYTVFHMKISNNIFYLSIDYETASGKLDTHCVNHSMRFVCDGKFSMHIIDQDLTPLTVKHTPHIYVTDSGSGVKFDLDYKEPFLDGGFAECF